MFTLLSLEVLCPRCQTNERLDGSGYCRACWSEYMRNWRSRSMKQQLTKVRHEGAELFRTRAVAAFREVGLAELNGYTALAILERLEP